MSGIYPKCEFFLSNFIRNMQGLSKKTNGRKFLISTYEGSDVNELMVSESLIRALSFFCKASLKGIRKQGESNHMSK